MAIVSMTDWIAKMIPLGKKIPLNVIVKHKYNCYQHSQKHLKCISPSNSMETLINIILYTEIDLFLHFGSI